jgi:hypothetical protein
MNSISNQKMENKMTSALDLAGEEVRCSLGGGSFISGVVQQVNDDHVIVRGRSFPLSAVQLREDVEHLRKSNIDTDRRLRRVEQEAADRVKITYSAEFLQLWQEAKIENKLRAQRVDLETALVNAYQEDVMYTRSGRRAVKRAAVKWLVSDTTEARERLFNHIISTGALAIEPTDESLPIDSEWYTSLCGECFPENNDSVHVISQVHHHRGTEYRVTFPIPEFELPEQFNYQTMFSGGAGRFTINSKELFTLMIKEGMRL